MHYVVKIQSCRTLIKVVNILTTRHLGVKSGDCSSLAVVSHQTTKIGGMARNVLLYSTIVANYY
jgi:hypothetical protein